MDNDTVWIAGYIAWRRFRCISALSEKERPILNDARSPGEVDCAGSETKTTRYGGTDDETGIGFSG